MSVKFKPLQDRVLVKPQDKEEKTAGGLYIPDTAKDKPMRGTIVATGPGYRSDNGTLNPMDVVEGDLVLFGKYAGTEVEIENQKYLIMSQNDLLGVVVQ